MFFRSQSHCCTMSTAVLMNVNGSISDAELLLSRTHEFPNGMFRIPVGRNDCVCTQSEAL